MHEHRRAQVTEAATHQPETGAEHRHVAKVERGLKEAVHARLEEEVVDRVEVHVGRGRSRRQERRPMPAIVFGIEQEVGADDGDADCHRSQNAQYQQNEPIDVVDFVGPE